MASSISRLTIVLFIMMCSFSVQGEERLVDSVLTLRQDESEQVVQLKETAPVNLLSNEQMLLMKNQESRLGGSIFKEDKVYLIWGSLMGLHLMVLVVLSYRVKEHFSIIRGEKVKKQRSKRHSKNNAPGKLLTLVEPSRINDRPDNLDKIESLKKSKILTKDQWEEYKKKLNEVFPNLLPKLYQDYPELTQAEVRLFVLIYLELSSSEQSDMLGVSVSSLRKSRYRLKKKLGVIQVSLYDYIRDYFPGCFDEPYRA